MIFDVIILNESGERVYYEWAEDGEALAGMYLRSENYITACAPSLVIDKPFIFQFGHFCVPGTLINQVFATHFKLFFENPTVDEIIFKMGRRE